MHAPDHDNGVIYPLGLYTLDSLKRKLGITDSTLRAARRDGLIVHYRHGRGFILGQDWITYICSSSGYQGNHVALKEGARHE